jgi:hypothetical protein
MTGFGVSYNTPFVRVSDLTSSTPPYPTVYLLGVSGTFGGIYVIVALRLVNKRQPTGVMLRRAVGISKMDHFTPEGILQLEREGLMRQLAARRNASLLNLPPAGSLQMLQIRSVIQCE